MQHKGSFFLWLGIFFSAFLSADDKQIFIIIPSYNNSRWYKQNIDSVLVQKYDHYHVIYIDDCSSDGTGELVQNYVQACGLSDRFTIINNTKRRGALANLYDAIHACQDDHIILTLDGDDWLADENVLTEINRVYQDENVWMTYGQFKTHPQQTIGFCREMPSSIVRGNFFREYDWITSHARTFYAGLFKKVALGDLLYEGSFFDVTWDMAFMYPMLEMASFHAVFIPKVLYVYNQENPLNDFRKKVVRQLHCKYHILSKKKYTPISHWKDKQLLSVHLIIFAQNAEQNVLIDFLSYCDASVEHVASVTVLCAVDFDATEVVEKYPSFKFCTLSGHTLQEVLTDLLSQKNYSHVVLTDTATLFFGKCNMQLCAHSLQKTRAGAFFMSISPIIAQSVPPLEYIFNNIGAWQLKHGSFAFKRLFDVSMMMYDREFLYQKIQEINFDTVQEMIHALNETRIDEGIVGLCFDQSLIQRNVICTKK